MADIKTEYAASAAMTITLAALASSATRVAGRESDAVNNTANLYLDYLVAGKVTTGTNPTVNKQIDVWVYASLEDTPTYPDVMDGADSAETWTSVDIRNAGAVLAAVVTTDATSDRTYWFKPFSIAAMFGGRMPKYFGIWVTHDTGVNLNNVGSNQAFWYTPVYADVA